MNELKTSNGRKWFFSHDNPINKSPEGRVREIVHVIEFIELANLSESETYLSLGSGQGGDCFEACRRCMSVVGVEVVPELVEIATKAKNIRYVCADACSPDLKVGERFDVCGLKDFMEHISYEQGLQALKNAYKHLKYKGRLIVHTPTIHPQWLHYNAQEPLIIDDKMHKVLTKVPRDHCILYSLPLLINRVIEAGFMIQAAWIGTKNTLKYTEEIIARDITGWEIWIIAKRLEQ